MKRVLATFWLLPMPFAARVANFQPQFLPPAVSAAPSPVRRYIAAQVSDAGVGFLPVATQRRHVSSRSGRNGSVDYDGLPDDIKAVLKPPEYAKLMEVMPNWEKNLARASVFAICEELLLAEIPGVLSPKALAIREYLSPGAMKLLTEADKSCPAKEWVLSYPRVDKPETVNLPALQSTFQEAEKEVVQGLATVTSKGPKLLAVQGGMGIGKSHVLDIADQLLFVNKDPIVLKVSYNFSQALTKEKQDSALGFLARLVLSFHRRVSPGSEELVKRAIMQNRGDLTTKAVVKWIREQPGDADKRPIIIAVDEVAKLGHEGCGAILSQTAKVMEEFWEQSNHKQPAIGVVTALPNLDITSFCSRQPIILKPNALSEEDSKALLLQRCSPRTPTANELYEMQLWCGGHPRSLAAAADLYREKQFVPVPDIVAVNCEWKETQACSARAIAGAIKEAYLKGDKTLTGLPALSKLNDNAMVMRRSGRFAVALTVLYTAKKVDAGEDLRWIYKMLSHRPSDTPTKVLENTNIHWEFFKAQENLPVIPISLSPDTTQWWYCFNVEEPVVEATVLKPHGGVSDALTSIQDTRYYFPTAQNHRGFESMCVVSTNPGYKSARRALCLFQSKVNGDLGMSIMGLNEAADDLRSIWNGEFLFVVFALDAPSGTKTTQAKIENAKHPTVLVTRQNAADYFTATLASAAELCWARHQEGRII